MAEPLIIRDWENGIAESPHKGFGLMRNADIESSAGALRTQKKPVSIFTGTYSSVFTADASTNILTAVTSGVPVDKTCVRLTTTGTLPAPLTTGTNRFITKLSSTTFKLSTTIAEVTSGTTIDITDAGSGQHTVTTLNPSIVNHIVKDKRNDVEYLLDSDGVVWHRDSGGTFVLSGNLTGSGNGAEGNGLAIFNFSSTTTTYLFAFRNAQVDVVNVFGIPNVENPSWNNDWFGLNSGAGSGRSHHAIIGQDNIIYFADDRYVGSIKENSGTTFDPTSGATYTQNNQALDLPPLERAEWLDELGINLMIAGVAYSKIYPWDRTSSSFNLPLQVPESAFDPTGTNKMRIKNIGNILYICAGKRGNIYTSQGTYVKPFVSLSEQVVNTTPTISESAVTWGGIASRNGALLIGVGATTTANSGAYLIYPDGRYVIDTIPSTGGKNATALYADSDFYLMGYSGGADYFDGTRYSSFETVVQSPLYSVATKVEKAGWGEIEAQFARPASTGTARIRYRTDTSSAFSDFPSGTVTFTADGTNTSFSQDIGLIDIENIQIQVEMDGTFELKEVRLLP